MECNRVFVYGSLLADEVVVALLKRIPPCSNAVLRDYRRCSVKNRNYPAAIYSQGSCISGKVLLDLTIQEMEVLDCFEGDEYVKQVVQPSMADGTVTSFMYLWKNSEDPELLGDWDYEEWRASRMAAFLKKEFSPVNDS